MTSTTTPSFAGHAQARSSPSNLHTMQTSLNQAADNLLAFVENNRNMAREDNMQNSAMIRMTNASRPPTLQPQPTGSMYTIGHQPLQRPHMHQVPRTTSTSTHIYGRAIPQNVIPNMSTHQMGPHTMNYQPLPTAHQTGMHSAHGGAVQIILPHSSANDQPGHGNVGSGLIAPGGGLGMNQSVILSMAPDDPANPTSPFPFPYTCCSRTTPHPDPQVS